MDPELHDRLDELQLDSWLVARDADVREVLRRPEDFSSANALRPDVMPPLQLQWPEAVFLVRGRAR
ncbi:hypothetical protein PUT24_08725 [Streptomyces sp. SP17KL33]|nr:hypothetical protein [Streptomyces sp. SP17KL33]MEE1830933.1 hypothetical protein [Streptomyces sp. SP17KL33]